GKHGLRRSGGQIFRCVRIAVRQPHPRDRVSVCSVTAVQHIASVSPPVRRFPSPPRQRNSVGAEAPFASSVCLRSMLRQGKESFTKAHARGDTLPDKEEENMSKTIEQITAVTACDPIPIMNPKAALKGIRTGQKPVAAILKSMLTSLSEGHITDFVAGFQS